MEHRAGEQRTSAERSRPHGAGPGWIVVAAACFVFLINIASPPRLMDDVDAVQAQIARNMLISGDWVTARLDGVGYLEKAPLVYWMMAASYKVFGVNDWAARLPLALAVVLLCFVTYRFGRWAFDEQAGTFAGIILASSVGLFLFTRILIPDAVLTLAITGGIWAWLRLLEPDEEHPHRWAAVMGLCFGAGLLLKGLIAVVFPVLAGLAFMAITRQLFSWTAWKKQDLWLVATIALLIAAPWHILATINNPPAFAFSLHSGPGEYRGFFWFYFFNEHLLRFLNMRYPRDYNTVPRVWFWLLNLVWLFPWSVYLPAAMKESYTAQSRASRARLMAICWIGVVMVFFTFSTTQEYYSMPIYPALALLIGSALASRDTRLRVGTWILQGISVVVSVALAVVLLMVWGQPATGDISRALTQHPEMYTLSMGHMGDLTLGAFAYLRMPLALAVIAFAAIALGLALWRNNIRRTVMVVAAGMIIFFQAARLALVRFDAYLGSYPLAQSLMQSPPGQLVEANSYYAFSSVFFYTGRTALLLNGRNNNLEYGSYAPGAPNVFIDDAKFSTLWRSPSRYYLLAYGDEKARLENLVGPANLRVVAENAGNYLFTNLAISSGQK
ncbi:MAG TPA: glycosyltransferase family 39 protein [Candidatus Angelobacter sp.]